MPLEYLILIFRFSVMHSASVIHSLPSGQSLILTEKYELPSGRTESSALPSWKPAILLARSNFTSLRNIMSHFSESYIIPLSVHVFQKVASVQDFFT
jgi:hypothetical protein